MKKHLIYIFGIFLLTIIFSINTSLVKANTPDFSNHDVRIISNVPLENFDKALGGKLKNKGKVYIDAGKANGIDPLFLAGISMHESANGDSTLLRKANNVGGIKCRNAKDRSDCIQLKANGSWWQKFNSIDDSIKFKAELLKKNYVDQGRHTVVKIQKKYCPDSDADCSTTWVSGVSKHMYAISNGESNGGKGDISKGEEKYSDGNEVGSLMNKYIFVEGDLSVKNVGVDNKNSISSKINNYGIFVFGSKLGLFLLRIAQVSSIFLLGYISLMWLLASMSYMGIVFASNLLHKWSFGQIDVLEKDGFKKLFIYSFFSIAVIGLILTGLIPKAFALIYEVIRQLLEFISRVSFM